MRGVPVVGEEGRATGGGGGSGDGAGGSFAACSAGAGGGAVLRGWRTEAVTEPPKRRTAAIAAIATARPLASGRCSGFTDGVTGAGAGADAFTFTFTGRGDAARERVLVRRGA